MPMDELKRAGRALLLAEGFRLQYRVLRCAALHFSEVFVLGTSEAGTLRFSRACNKFLPFRGEFRHSDESTAKLINDVCNQFGIEFVLPSCAETTRYLTTRGIELTVPHFPVPSRDVFDALDDKWRFATLCADSGVPHPRTMHFETYDALLDEADQGRLSFPIVMKPLNMWGSFGVRKISSRQEMPAEIEYKPILIQEYISGEDYCAFFLCDTGQIVRSIGYSRKLGVTVFIEDSEVSKYAKLFVERLSYNGVLGFDVRRKVDGEIFFIECNPRFWYRMDLALIHGLNIVAAGHQPEYYGKAHPQTLRGTTVLSPKQLLLTLLAPWRLSRHDIAFLKYLARDPIVTMLAGVRSVLGSSRQAGGQTLALAYLLGRISGAA